MPDETDKPKRSGRRRDRGEDSLYQRASDHRWIVEIRNGYKPSGYPDITYLTAKGYPDDSRENRKRNTEAKATLLRRRDEARAKIQRGLPVSNEVLTVKAYLDRWLETTVKPSKRATTYESYEGICRVHLVPALGRKQLAKLTPQDVQEMMAKMLQAGTSPTTVKNTRAILRKALNDAMRDDRVSRNVVTLTSLPAQRVFHPKPLTEAELKRFTAACRGHRLEALFLMLAAIGLRAGEAFGLRWEDVDLNEGMVRVRYQIQRIGTPKRPVFVDPKTERSRRPVPIPTAIVSTLRNHIEIQKRERLIAGSNWKGETWQNLVFCTTTGTPLDPANVAREYKAILRKGEIDPNRRLHDLRHTCATMLARMNVHPRQAQEILRHAQISTTLAVYTSVGADSLRSAVDQMGTFFDQAEEEA